MICNLPQEYKINFHFIDFQLHRHVLLFLLFSRRVLCYEKKILCYVDLIDVFIIPFKCDWCLLQWWIFVRIMLLNRIAVTLMRTLINVCFLFKCFCRCLNAFTSFLWMIVMWNYGIHINFITFKMRWTFYWVLVVATKKNLHGIFSIWVVSQCRSNFSFDMISFEQRQYHHHHHHNHITYFSLPVAWVCVFFSSE